LPAAAETEAFHRQVSAMDAETWKMLQVRSKAMPTETCESAEMSPAQKTLNAIINDFIVQVRAHPDCKKVCFSTTDEDVESSDALRTDLQRGTVNIHIATNKPMHRCMQ